MINPATTTTKDDFNVFTRYLQSEINAGKTPLVTLRDGRIVPISWFTDDGPEYEHFIYKNDALNIYLIWENDGHSIHSRRFDMIELYEG